MGGRGPELSLDWEEGLFKLVGRLWRKLRPGPPPPGPHAFVALTQGRTLEALAGVVAGEPMRVLDAAGVGGLRGVELLVPSVVSDAATWAENRELVLLRVLVGAEARRLSAGRTLPTDARAVVATFRAASRSLAESLAGFPLLHLRVATRTLAAAPPPLRGVLAAALDLEGPWPAPEFGPADESLVVSCWGTLLAPPADAGAVTAGSLPTRTLGAERKGRNVDAVNRVTLDERRARERVVTHSFEKIETLEEHRGQLQRMDGADELDEHGEALDELDLRELIRGGEAAESMVKAEVGLGSGIPDVARVEADEVGLPYDEWDEARGAFRPGWCTVYAAPVREHDPAWLVAATVRHRRLVDELHRRLLVHRGRRRPRARQREGEDVDVDALVDELADRRAGRTPSDRVYVDRPRAQRSFATTVLLDVSLSTDAWMDDQRVLDVARESVLVLGDVADRLGDTLQVLAFASHTRNRCRVWTLRDWNEPWATARGRLGALRPQGYTRIGPALRHGTRELLRSGADHRLLLLLSDGRPTDLDRYEGRHGTADVRHAWREASASGVHTHVLAIDRAASATLAATFGDGSWHVVPHPGALPEALATVYGRMHG